MRGGIWGELSAHCHKRSDIGTSFSMVKAEFGGCVYSKLERCQVSEGLSKVLCHNICVVIHSIYALGMYRSFTEEPAAAH